MRTLSFYFDFVSPYAYLAWTQIHTLAARHGCEVAPLPVLFAGLLDANGHLGPAEIPRKRVYVFKDSVRSAARLGVPIAAPASHPFNPLLALRVASADLRAEERRVLIDGLFTATWARSLDVTDPGIVTEVARAAGLDGPGLVAWAGTAAAKERVRQRTDEALQAGAFGVPTMIVLDDLFWGLDSLPNLERFLAGHDPIAHSLSAPWPWQVVASATRRAAMPDDAPFVTTRDVTVRAEAFEKATRFYEEILGSSPRPRGPHRVGFETGAFQLFVEKGAPRGATFELSARDWKAARARLLAAGCQVVEEDAQLSRCHMVDPFGSTFSLR